MERFIIKLIEKTCLNILNEILTELSKEAYSRGHINKCALFNDILGKIIEKQHKKP